MTRARRQYHNRLRKHRRLMGYTQREVARLLGLNNTSSLSRWEKGVAMPSVENLLRLAYLYRTFSDELYFDLSLELRRALQERERKLVRHNSNPPNGP